MEIYKKVLLIRIVEEKLLALFKRGAIPGTAHLCIGQEFIPVIVSSNLKKEDTVTSTHRGHGHAISKGLDLKKFLSEVMAKEQGYCKGKGGTQHVISYENNFYANGITAGMVPIATGIAFSNKFYNNDNIVVSYFGDGGFNEGYFQESLNIQSLLNLPILLICENNLYAMGTGMKFTHSAPIIDRVSSFGIECASIETNDYKKLYDTTKKFIEKIRKDKKPRFIEIQTYRFCGHSVNDKNLYRDKNEEKKWEKNDVLKKIEGELIEKKISTRKNLNSIRLDTETEINNMINEIEKY